MLPQPDFPTIERPERGVSQTVEKSRQQVRRPDEGSPPPSDRRSPMSLDACPASEEKASYAPWPENLTPECISKDPIPSKYHTYV
jgi:hypothetical protein